jgi:exosome complex exonuclease DIS3/RRP44
MTYRWCEQQLESYGCRVILLTNDKKNKEKALASKLLACTGDTKFQKWLFVTHTLFMLEVQEYASSLPAWPELLDLTSSGDMYDGGNSGVELFNEYISLSRLHEEVKAGRMHQGTFHARRDNHLEGHVTISSLNSQVLVCGAAHVNRSVDGDIVGVELLAEEEWSTPSNASILPDDEVAEKVKVCYCHSCDNGLFVEALNGGMLCF